MSTAAAIGAAGKYARIASMSSAENPAGTADVGSGAARESFSRSSMSRRRAIRSFKSTPAALGFAAGLGQLARIQIFRQLFIRQLRVFGCDVLDGPVRGIRFL